MKHTISVLVADEFGVLTRISGLFARRGFSIDSIAIGASEESGISRITMVLPGSNSLIQQIINQLYKLINVIEVKDINPINPKRQKGGSLKPLRFGSRAAATVKGNWE